MNKEGERSVFVSIPKPKVYSKTSVYNTIKKTKRRTDKSISKPAETSPIKYTQQSNEPLKVHSIKQEELLLPYKFYSRKQARKNHALCLTIDIYDKYKIAYTDHRKRLNVDDPRNDTYTVTDFDKDFYKCMEAHKLSKYAPVFKSITSLFDQHVRLKQKIAYINDYIINIEILRTKEMEIYNQSVEKYVEQVKYLEEFISLDYKKSIDCLGECDKLANEVHNQEIELQNIATEKFTIASRLIGLDYLYSLQQKYGRFLYYLSPPSWRLKHRDFARSVEIEARGFDFNCSSDEDTFNVIFEKMKSECYRGLIKPVLYFEEPSGLMDVFVGIEKQQLYHFSHITQVEPHTKFLRKSITMLKDEMIAETAEIVNTIKHFKLGLQFLDNRCSVLEAKFFKILHGMFYESIAIADVLKLQFYLEFSYEKVYSEKPYKLDIVTTAKVLEKIYLDLNKKIDNICSDKVKLAIEHYTDMELKKMKRAKIANRELIVFSRLQRHLSRAHTFVDVKIAHNKREKVNVKSIKRKQSTHRYSKPKIVENNQQLLTEAQREYLALFTEWTENDDPADYLQNFSEAGEQSDCV